MPFPREVIDHFEHPRFAGDLEHANVRVRVENPVCGDVLELAAVCYGGRFAQVRFRAKGCVASMAAGSMLAERLTQTTCEQAAALTRQQIVEALGGLTPESMHVSHLAADGVRELVRRARALRDSE